MPTITGTLTPRFQLLKPDLDVNDIWGANDHLNYDKIDEAVLAIELVTVSGYLQGEIDAVEIPGEVNSVNDVTGAVLVTGTQNVTTQTSGQTITITGPDLSSFATSAEVDGDITTHAGIANAHHDKYTDSEAITALEPTTDALATEIVTTSGHLQTEIDAAALSGDIANAMVGSDGITVTSGDPTDTISGFYAEFVNASGTLETSIDTDIATHAAIANAHHTKYTNAEAISALEPTTSALAASGVATDATATSHTADASAHHVRYADSEAITALEPTTGALAASGVATDANVTTNASDIADNTTLITTTSGFLQSEIDAHHTKYTDQEAIDALEPTTSALAASGVATDANVALNAAEIVTVSGHLQSELDAVEASDVDSVNAQTGAITITGTTGVNTVTAGSTITLTSEDSEIDHDALLNFTATEHFTEGSINHEFIVNIGANSHSDIDVHIADDSLHFAQNTIDHTAITNIGSNDHAAIDAHVADTSLHFVEVSIDHNNITNIGSSTHTELDAHLIASTVHFTEGSIDHTLITNVGTNAHAQIDTHIGDASTHFTENQINHTGITNIGVNTHAQIDTHLGALAASGTANAAEIVTVSGFLQSEIDAHHTKYTDQEAIDALEPTTSALAASGVATDANLVSVSGHLQSEIDGVESGALQNVVEDLTPELGGDLSLNGNDILGGSSGINITTITGADIVMQAGGDGDITIEAGSNRGTDVGDLFLYGDNRVTIRSWDDQVVIHAASTIDLESPTHLNSGSLGTLPFAFISDTDSGWYRPNDNTLAIVAGGATRVTVSGNDPATHGMSIEGNLTVTGSIGVDTGAFSTGLTVSGVPVLTATHAVYTDAEAIAALEPTTSALAASGVATDAQVVANRTEFVNASGTIQAEVDTNTAGIATNVTDISTNAGDISALTTSGVAQDVLIAADPIIPFIEVSATVNTATTSGTYETIESMTSTPASGTYLATFSTTMYGDSVAQDMQFALFSAGSIIQHSERNVNVAGGVHVDEVRFAVQTQAVTTVNGSQAIEVHFQTSVGTLTVQERSMILIKIAN